MWGRFIQTYHVASQTSEIQSTAEQLIVPQVDLTDRTFTPSLISEEYYFKSNYEAVFALSRAAVVLQPQALLRFLPK